jgi:hypothetical protein
MVHEVLGPGAATMAALAAVIGQVPPTTWLCIGDTPQGGDIVVDPTIFFDRVLRPNEYIVFQQPDAASGTAKTVATRSVVVTRPAPGSTAYPIHVNVVVFDAVYAR